MRVYIYVYLLHTGRGGISAPITTASDRDVVLVQPDARPELAMSSTMMSTVDEQRGLVAPSYASASRTAEQEKRRTATSFAASTTAMAN